MDGLRQAADWFAGGSTPYHTLIHCMSHDTLWIAITVTLDIAVAAGYGLIALHWWRNQRSLPPSDARRALGNMRDIFIFCGICGYLFIPIKMFWPAWRLYDMFMVVLVYLTWRYAWGARDLKVVYSALRRTGELEQELATERQENQRRNFFLNAISHDLKNPLYGISLQAQLASEVDDPQMVKRSLGAIRAACHEASQLLDQFLELGRADRVDERDVGNRVDVDAGVLLGEMAESHRARAEAKGLALDTRCTGHVRLRTNAVHLKRVLTNILDNAIKFTDKGSVALVAELVDGVVCFHVSDTGPGVPTEHLDCIFDDFYQVHNDERERSKGYGLGLAIAHRLATRLGGTIRVDSRPGSGCRFTVALPAEPAPQPGDEPDAVGATPQPA